jgi:cytochrome c553
MAWRQFIATPSISNIRRNFMRFVLSVVACLCAMQTTASAGDAAAGQKKVVKCVVCHGKDGISKNPAAPNLSGQVESYLVNSLMAFRAGERKNDMMSVVVKGLTDEDIANLAAYYSSIKITVEKPQ